MLFSVAYQWHSICFLFQVSVKCPSLWSSVESTKDLPTSFSALEGLHACLILAHRFLCSLRRSLLGILWTILSITCVYDIQKKHLIWVSGCPLFSGLTCSFAVCTPSDQKERIHHNLAQSTTSGTSSLLTASNIEDSLSARTELINFQSKGKGRTHTSCGHPKKTSERMPGGTLSETVTFPAPATRNHLCSCVQFCFFLRSFLARIHSLLFIGAPSFSLFI